MEAIAFVSKPKGWTDSINMNEWEGWLERKDSVCYYHPQRWESDRHVQGVCD